MIAKELAARVEHTLFAAEATARDIERLCEEAKQNSFYAVCVNGSRVELTRARVEESAVRVVALIGFPLGAADADAKRYEVEIAIDQGAHEIDFVINHGWLNDGESRLVLRELRDIVEAADERPVKALIELELLSQEEKLLFCKIAQDSGVGFIGAGTGYPNRTTSIDEIRLLSDALVGELGIKAAGVRDLQTAQALIDAGATRIGTTAGIWPA